MVDAGRRRFLRKALEVAGLGLVVAGFGDLGFEELSQQSTAAVPPATSTTTASANYLPDYLDFLQWLNGASKPFAGKPLNLSLEAEFTPLSLEKRDFDFFSFSKINDQYSTKPYSLQLADVSLMVSTRSSTYDAFSVDNQNLGLFNQHLVPLTQLVQQYPELTYPKLDLHGFGKYPWDHVAHYPTDDTIPSGGDTNNVFLLPHEAPLMVLFYRKDIYSKLGLSLPNTWSEYLEDMKTIKSSGLVPFPTVCEAYPDVPVVYEFLNHLASFGGQLWEVDAGKLTPIMNSDASVAALENLVSLKPYADPGSLAYSWEDTFNAIAHGVAATGLLWHDYINWANDPIRSTRVGQIGLKKNPAGEAGSYSTFGGGGVGISKYSKNPEVAWLWLQWATAAGTQETLLLDPNHVLPTRDSALNSPDLAQAILGDAYQAPRLAQTILQSGGVTSLIGFPKWFQVLDPLSFHLNRAWVGSETPREALNLAQQRIIQLGSLTFL